MCIRDSSKEVQGFLQDWVEVVRVHGDLQTERYAHKMRILPRNCKDSKRFGEICEDL